MSRPDTGDFPTVRRIDIDTPAPSLKRGDIGAAKSKRPLESENLVGSTLDRRFRILERIGQGGMSEVYKAEHVLLQKMVAIKVLHKQQESLDQGIERFQQEAKAISALDHRNIVKIYAFGASEEDRFYLAMDYLEGQSLADVLAEHKHLTWQRVQKLALQIAQGLEQAHSRGIIHRDLKPSNIIIEKDDLGEDLAKVVDFGIAKLTADSGKEIKQLTQDGNTCGSPPYMSPEQCMGELADARSDIYSLGIMMYELLIGERPIKGRSVMEMMTNHLKQTPAFFKQVSQSIEIPDSFESIVRKCLEKEPTARYQNMVELQRDLAQIGSYSDDESKLESINKRAMATAQADDQKKRSKKLVLTVVAATSSVLVLATGLYLWQLPQIQTNELKSKLDKIDLAAPGMRQRIAEILPPLLSKYQQRKDSASALAAVRQLKKRIQRLPNSPNKWVGLAQLADYMETLGLTEEATTIKKVSIKELYSYGEQMDRIGNEPEAEIAFNECLRLCINLNEPRTYTLSVINALTHNYIRQGKLYLAENISRKGIHVAKGGTVIEEAMANFNLANALFEQARFAEAEEFYRKSLEISLREYVPSSPFSKNIGLTLAKDLQKQQKYAEAEQVLKNLSD